MGKMHIPNSITIGLLYFLYFFKHSLSDMGGAASASPNPHSEQPVERPYKVVIVGGSSTGKSSIFDRLITNEYHANKGTQYKGRVGRERGGEDCPRKIENFLACSFIYSTSQ